MIQLPDMLGLWALPLAVEIALLTLEAFILVSQGAKHGFHYAMIALDRRTLARLLARDVKGTVRHARQKARENLPGRQRWMLDNLELHYTDRRLMWGLYALLIIAGCDVLRVLLVQSVARPVFQGLINWGAGRDFIDRSEPKSYGEKKRGQWKQIPKRITGMGRVAWAALAFVLLFYEPIIHQLTG